jgi:hypothetical protein
MKIPRVEDLPDAASRPHWAEALRLNESTLYRADRQGKLQASRVGGRTVIYTKRAILKWLGIDKQL